MNAIIFEEFGDAKVQSIPKPKPDSNEVLVSVDRVQLSVTECALFHGEDIFGAEVVQERFANGDGRLFGHEFCGTVTATGDDVDSFKAGQRVYAPGKIACGDCPQCAAGFEALCKRAATLGLHRPGALAEFVAAPAAICRPLPAAISDAEGAALQPLADVTKTIHDVNIETGETVAVIGSGVMGFASGQVAQTQGAGEVFAIDVEDRKVSLAENQGMIGIDAAAVDPVDAILSATDGRGADVVVEAVGGEQQHGTEGSDPLAQAVHMARPGGTVVQMGLIPGSIQLKPRELQKKSLRWLCPIIGLKKPSPSMDLGQVATTLVASDRVTISEYVTHVLSGLDTFEEAIQITSNKDEYAALGPAQIIV